MPVLKGGNMRDGKLGYMKYTLTKHFLSTI